MMSMQTLVVVACAFACVVPVLAATQTLIIGYLPSSSEDYKQIKIDASNGLNQNVWGFLFEPGTTKIKSIQEFDSAPVFGNSATFIGNSAYSAGLGHFKGTKLRTLTRSSWADNSLDQLPIKCGSAVTIGTQPGELKN